MNKPIGIFDSGVGGLTVLKALKQILPQENYFYYADTAHVPYGSKTKEEIISYNEKIISFLISHNAKIIVAACGTSSAVALENNREKFDLPIFGLIDAAAQKAVKISRNKKIGIIATQLTINSHAYKNSLLKFSSDLKVFEKSCPLFVPIVEGNKCEESQTYETVANYLEELKNAEIDTLILGCTHYPYLKKPIRKFLGENVNLVDPSQEIAFEIASFLKSKNWLNPNHQPPTTKFFASGEINHFKEIGERFLGCPIYVRINDRIYICHGASSSLTRRQMRKSPRSHN
jgi:glutamate racemase